MDAIRKKLHAIRQSVSLDVIQGLKLPEGVSETIGCAFDSHDLLFRRELFANELEQFFHFVLRTDEGNFCGHIRCDCNTLKGAIKLGVAILNNASLFSGKDNSDTYHIAIGLKFNFSASNNPIDVSGQLYVIRSIVELVGLNYKTNCFCHGV